MILGGDMNEQYLTKQQQQAFGKVYSELFKRYTLLLSTLPDSRKFEMVCGSTIQHIHKLASESVKNSLRDDLTIDKKSRHLGYIQAAIIHLGLSTVDAERTKTRKLFHKIAKNPTIE